MSAPTQPILYSFPDTSNLSDSLADYILKSQKEAIDKRNRFTVAISGGSLPKTLTALISKPGVQWDKWQVSFFSPCLHTPSLRSAPSPKRHVFYADERVVPLDHADSNHKLALDTLFSKVAIPRDNIHPIDESQLDDLEELSDAYEKELIKEFAQKDSARFPVFDLILLGIGPDGHTASLFPGHELLTENDRWVAYIEDSPKPPPRRVTLTFPVINHAARVAFVATGASKVQILSDILDTPELGLPAARVRPVAPGQLIWFVDDAASAQVKLAKSQFKL
jgi:6-phosphogluconolactonase